jgi:capsid protein
MRIPFYTAYSERKQQERDARMQMIQAETKMVKERTTAIRNMREQSARALEAIMDTATKPVMSLNDELYGAGSPYNTDIWRYGIAKTRRVSRIAHSQSPSAQALTGRFVDLVYGTHLELQSQPFFDLIPGAPMEIEGQQEIIKNIERRWWLWAKSKKSDYEEDKSYFEQARINFEELMTDGEYFLLLRYSQSRKRNPLTVQYIGPENVVRVNSQVANGNIEKDGIEYKGKVAVAYHILDCDTNRSIRVPRYGVKSGRTFVIHVKIGSKRRGIGLLAGIISELTKLSDFQALEIQAAVINALFAVWVETPIGGEQKNLLKKRGIGGIGRQIDEAASQFSSSEYETRLKSTDFQHGGMIVQEMGEGQKLNSFDTKRPTANFQDFYEATLRNLASAKGMSVSVMQYNFNGQYAAARGELLVLWLRVRTMRFDSIMQRENEIFKMWLWGEIDNGNVPDYGYGNDEFIRDAFSNAEWTGPARPDIDPLKSAKAHEVEENHSWKTNQQISAERGGGDFDENISRTTDEKRKKAKANEPIVKLEKTTYSNSSSVTESTSKMEE